MTFKTVRNFDLNEKRVLLRVDLNVPVQDGRVSDTTRIDRLKPTIDYLVEHGAKIIVLSHFGRPKGKVNPDMSLAFLPPVLTERWNCDVSFSPDCIGADAEKAASNLNPGDVLLLENLRFHEGEEKNTSAFATELAKLGDIYINDAFSAAHRATFSIRAVNAIGLEGFSAVGSVL